MIRGKGNAQGGERTIARDPAKDAVQGAAKGSAKGAAKAPHPGARALKLGGFRLFGNGHGAVGVDISPGKICLVRARRSGSAFEVQAMKTVRFDVSLDLYSDEAIAILRGVLDAFMAKGVKDALWASMVTSTSDMQLITIPKAAKKQIDNAVYWSAKRELDFDEGSVIFDYERRGEVTQKGASKIAAMVYSAPKADVQKRASLCARAGHPLAGLIMPSFSAQNIFRSLHGQTPPGGAAVLFVGWNWSRLEIFTDQGLVFNRVIKASMSGMEQSIEDALERRREERAASLESEPAAPGPAVPGPETETLVDLGGNGIPAAPPALTLMLDDDDVQVISEESSPAKPSVSPAPPDSRDARDEAKGAAASPLESEDDGGMPAPGENGERDAGDLLDESEGCEVSPAGEASAKKLLFCMIPGGANEDALKRAGYDEEDVFAMAMPAASRLARQVEMTIKHYQETLGNDPVGVIYVTGPLSPCERFVEFIGSSLGLPCEVFDPLADPAVAFVNSAARPASMTERVGYNLALGLALSENASTPNLLNTYVKKRHDERVARVNRYMLLGCAAGLIIMAGASFYQTMVLKDKVRELETLESELAKYSPKVDPEMMAQATAKAQKVDAAVKSFAARNQGLGAIGEAFSMLPENVKLTQVNVDLGEPEGDANGENGKRRTVKPRTLILEGLVTGNINEAESALAGYLVRLRGSSLFSESAVTKSEPETMTDSGGEALRFVVSLVLSEL